MTDRDYKMEFDNLIKEIIAPTFKERGFKKKVNNFYKATSDLTQIFNVQKSQWNSKDEIAFTFNIGFFHSGIYKETYNKPIPEAPKEYECFINLRSGFISHKKDYWYTLNSVITFDKCAADIKKDIQESAIDLFERYQTLDSLAGLIEDCPDIKATIKTIPRFIFLMKTNLRKDAVEFIISEYKNALIPKPCISITTYPDGRRVENKSEPKINQGYIDSLKRIAVVYNIELK
jgi:hypothetical protein